MEDLLPTALEVAVVVGSLLLLLNHGGAVIQGKMTCSCWLAAALTDSMRYTVSIHE
ncbi:MAG: nitrate/nitrite transporter NrtS [Myxacorys chilensis ATA2-1-KO14]|nr:nitrate/nitrite transporter NrtS [Myxacorys chilensis ATA2-1-KO14]